MPAYTLVDVADDVLLVELAALVASDRRTTASLLAHLAEVEARELFLPAACPSMYAYCVRVLHLSEDAAYKRIRAARVARRFPQLFDAISDGRMHVSGVLMLAPHLDEENVDELVAAAAHRSKTEIEMLVARLAPQHDLPTAMTPVADHAQLAPGPVASSPQAPVTGVKPLSPERYALQLTIDQETRDKLERLQALLRHRNPSGDLATVIRLAADALLVQVEKKKLGATTRPRPRKARPADADPRYVPNDVKRDVYERDRGQCTFVSDGGVRCTERGFLELDHRRPVARGGTSTVDGLRVLCKPHNQYEAQRVYGAAFMRGKREAARAARRERRASLDARGGEKPLAHAAVREPLPTEGDTPVPESAIEHESKALPGTTRVAADGNRPLLEDGNARAKEDGTKPAPEHDGGTALDADVSDALCGMGFKPKETRRAMAQSAGVRATTFEQRLRAALAQLSTGATRCSEATPRYRVAHDLSSVLH